MRSNSQPFGFGFNFATQSSEMNFTTDSVFTANLNLYNSMSPPATNYFLLLNGTDFGLLNGNNLNLL
jgi:hypothetical protein